MRKLIVKFKQVLSLSELLLKWNNIRGINAKVLVVKQVHKLLNSSLV